MTEREPVYALVCAGGGAHGAYQVGVLKYIHEHFCRGDASPFRIFSGTSAGSLNTAFYASRSYDARHARLELEQMWLDFHVPEYHRNTKRSLWRSVFRRWASKRQRECGWSLLDPGPLEAVVRHGFRRAAFERSVAEGTTIGAAMSATELRSSRLVWFADGPAASAWHSGSAISMEVRLDAPHIVASCSIPLVFPPVKIGDHYFSDGGVANKVPFGAPITMGATRILSVATDQPLPDHLPEYRPGFRPAFGDIAGMIGNQFSHDYATHQAQWIELVNYFRQQLPDRPIPEAARIMTGRRLEASHYRPVEIELFAPSKRIGHTDLFHPEYFDPDLKGTVTGLRFHSDFEKRLISFGYEDASARHETLAAFFKIDRPQRPSSFS